MLILFSCSNYKSIKERVTFSMLASKDDTNAQQLYSLNRTRKVLRTAAIYGANGSGKSNFIDAMSLAREIIVQSIFYQPGQKVPQHAHKLSDRSEPSTFDFQFLKDDVRYAYGYSVVEGRIDEEYLYFFPRGRKTKVFERKGMEVSPGSKYSVTSFAHGREFLKENRLLLSCMANYSQIQETEKAFRFFGEDLIIYRTEIDAPSSSNWFEYSIKIMENDPEVRKAFVGFLKALDTGIMDVSVKTEPVKPEHLSELPDKIREILFAGERERGFVSYQAKVDYGSFQTDLETEESTGIRKLFRILCPIMEILSHGRVFVCDEIETGLHESVVHKIIELFYRLEKDKFAQLIFTTHDTSLLDERLFRRDQIWFTELRPQWRSTDLYSLVEIRNVRKNENLAKGYTSGKYGAIPMLNQSFQAFVENYKEGSQQ